MKKCIECQTEESKHWLHIRQKTYCGMCGLEKVKEFRKLLKETGVEFE